jgi:plasmid stabilization system protein ParE
MTLSHPIVFLVDLDNTPLDNDGIQQDLKDHLERVFGAAARDRYWRILEDPFAELGYRDYLGARQRYRVREVELLSMSPFLIDYPFADRLFPAALTVLKRIPPADVTIERIVDLLDYDLPRTWTASQVPALSLESAR